MKLNSRLYTTNTGSIAIFQNPHNKYKWVIENEFVNNNINDCFKSYFTNNQIKFKTKKELFYHLNNIENNYNIKLLPLIHNSSRYNYKSYEIHYINISKKWHLSKELNNKDYKLLKSFNSLKEAINYVDYMFMSKTLVF